MESSITIKSELSTSTAEENLLETDAKSLLRLLILKCKEEMENNCLNKPLEDYVERVAHYTGLSKNIINQVISNDMNEIEYKYKYFELNDCKRIFEHMAKLYSKEEIPTIENMFMLYKSKNSQITFSQFEYMISRLGLEYRKTVFGQNILIEDPSLTFKRYLYLKQINDLRSKCAPIYYIDERFFDCTFTFPKPWLKNIDIASQACDGYVFFHAISKQGLLNSLFCSPTTKKDFVKWVSHILLPHLSGPSVIVMDNNDLNMSVVNTITKYDSKKDMLQYLRERNIPCNENMHKAELYELINKCLIKHVYYNVDEILKAHGHQVLRLPKNFHDLSLTHFLWKYFVNYESDLFLNKELPQIKIALLDRLSSLPQEIWETLHEELLATENDIIAIDSKIYNALETNYYRFSE